MNKLKKRDGSSLDMGNENLEAINRTKRLALVDGIRYQLIGDDHYYARELFEKEELTGYLKNTLRNWLWDRSPLNTSKLPVSMT